MLAYPQTLPLDAATLVAEIVKTRAIQTRKTEFAHAAWNVQGYIQKVTLGDPLPQAVGPDMEFEDVMNILLDIEGDLDAFEKEGVTLQDDGTPEAETEAVSIITVISVIGTILQAIQLWRNRNKEALDKDSPTE